MNKPGCHRTGLDAHFGVDTSVLRNTSRNWPGIGGADAAPEPLALLVDNADRGRLLRYVQPNIMRHQNLQWCKSPGNMPGSRHYRCLRLRTAITRGPHHQGVLRERACAFRLRAVRFSRNITAYAAESIRVAAPGHAPRRSELLFPYISNDP